MKKGSRPPGPWRQPEGHPEGRGDRVFWRGLFEGYWGPVLSGPAPN